MSRNLVELFRILERLKRTARTGWTDRGVPPPEVESVADHTLLTALIAWTLAAEQPGLDADRVLKLAIIHDLAEAIVGDRPPYEPHEVPPADDLEGRRAFFSVRHLRTPENAARKRQDEGAAARQLFRLMPDGVAGDMRGLWEEYETQATPEARFVKQVDTLEAYMQALTYAATDPELPLWGFTDMAEKEIDHPALTAIRDAAREEERE